MIRSDIEREITEEEFERLWPATNGRRLSKTRYLVPSGYLVREIDEFDELDLVLAEVELPDEHATAEPPPWLKPHIVRDVTDEKQYRNYQLALRLAAEGKS
jgi:adenylate cyclase